MIGCQECAVLERDGEVRVVMCRDHAVYSFMVWAPPARMLRIIEREVA